MTHNVKIISQKTSRLWRGIAYHGGSMLCMILSQLYDFLLDYFLLCALKKVLGKKELISLLLIFCPPMIKHCLCLLHNLYILIKKWQPSRLILCIELFLLLKFIFFNIIIMFCMSSTNLLYWVNFSNSCVWQCRKKTVFMGLQINFIIILFHWISFFNANCSAIKTAFE